MCNAVHKTTYFVDWMAKLLFEAVQHFDEIFVTVENVRAPASDIGNLMIVKATFFLAC